MTPTLHCESPIEERMAEELSKHFHDGVVWETQRPVTARGRRFRLDFFAECAGRKVAIECDGKDFHDYRDDRIRDALMLDAGAVDDVMRFRGCDIYFAMEECLACLNWFCRFLADPTVEPYDLDAKLLNSHMLRDKQTKPIYRFRAPIIELALLPRNQQFTQTAHIMGKTSDGKCCVGEVVADNFNRTFEGPRFWRLGDYLRYHVDKMRSGQE